MIGGTKQRYKYNMTTYNIQLERSTYGSTYEGFEEGVRIRFEAFDGGPERIGHFNMTKEVAYKLCDDILMYLAGEEDNGR
jgi:hypothetical protein